MDYKKKKRIRELTHEILDMFQIDIPIKDIREVTRKRELPGYKYPGFKGKKPSHFSHLTG